MQPFFEQDKLSLYCGDLRPVLPTLPENSVDFVVTDPPYLLNFMEKEWDKAGDGDIPTNELVFRYWFAGLVAGEACFRIHREKDGAYYACEFSIKIRADEGPLLRALARRIGAGKVQDIPAESGVVNSGPAVKWVVHSREECWKIAQLLDGTPLYAKKQREYDLWRCALQVWTDRPRGNRWQGRGDNSAMEALWNEMKALRPFDLELADSHFDPFGQPAYLFHYQWAKACLRVVKPGGLLLAFGGTRTYHRLICAVEDAGWEIRDCLMWLHGQGFPKAADIGKMIDKAKGAVREVVGTKLGQRGYSLADNGRTNDIYGDLHNPEAECAITAPATAEAAKWTGWAAALKPAWEPIVLAMKPMDGTQAHNAMTWGVAGMNIDAARVGENPGYKYNADHNGTTFHGKQGERIKQSATKKGSAVIESTKGRWPGNLLLDEEAAHLLDAQTGTLTSGTGVVRTKAGDGYHGGMGKAGDAQVAYGDSGGASRFFYVAKATTKERNKGCEQVVTWEDVDLSQETDELLQHAKAISAIGTSLLDGGEWNTMLSGSNITDQSRMATVFTMSTLTRLITELRTFSFSHSSNTNASILAATKTLLATGLSLADVAGNIDRLRTSTSGELASLLGVVGAALRTLLRISAKGRRGNTHCTVKPVKLMEYLLTLLSTPDGGVILDPFAGSGSTLLAAQRLGRRCIGVELTEHNCEIAKSRLQA